MGIVIVRVTTSMHPTLMYHALEKLLINAIQFLFVYMQGYEKQCKYIACQGKHLAYSLISFSLQRITFNKTTMTRTVSILC